MTEINLETTSKDFQEGFISAIRMIIKTCEFDLLQSREQIMFSLKVTLRLYDLMINDAKDENES